MSGYGSHKWTCGECGDSYEASGVMGDLQVNRWARDHRERHRVDKMPEADRAEHFRHLSEGRRMFAAMEREAQNPPPEQGLRPMHG